MVPIYSIGVIFRFCLVIVLIGLLSSCQETLDKSSHNNEVQIPTVISGDTLTLGSISNVVQNELFNYNSLMSYLSDSLKDVGISSVKIEIARSLEEMQDLLNENKVDLYSDSPYPISIILNKTSAEPFLKQYKAGVEYYKSVIFVRKDSGIESVDDLLGKIIGFEIDYSTSGYVLPKLSLMEKGYSLNYIEFKNTPLKKDVINYTFTGNDENTVYWVIAKRIDAGVTDNISFSQYSGASLSELDVIYETKEVPRQIVLINNALRNDVKNRLRSLLLNMHNDKIGKSVLKDYFGTAKFDTLNSVDLFSLNKFKKF